MQYNDTVNKLGICQEIDALCSTDSTSYPVADKTRRVNSSLETLIGKIINADGTWQFDDRNFTTLPEGTITLTAGTSSYSFSDRFLDIEEVKILGTDGVYRRIKPFDPSELAVSVEEYYGTASGFPEVYDKVEDTIRLYPPPSASVVTLAAGLKVRFKRTGSLFTAADTSKEPGIASPWHITLAKMSALPYNKLYHPERVPQMERDIAQETKDMLAFYGRREKDKRAIMTPKKISYI